MRRKIAGNNWSESNLLITSTSPTTVISVDPIYIPSGVSCLFFVGTAKRPMEKHVVFFSGVRTLASWGHANPEDSLRRGCLHVRQRTIQQIPCRGSAWMSNGDLVWRKRMGKALGKALGKAFGESWGFGISCYSVRTVTSITAIALWISAFGCLWHAWYA